MYKLQELNALLDFLKEHNKFYAKKLERVSLPISSVLQLPILYRKDIREYSEEIISDIVRKEEIKIDYTNGTTEGKALKILKTKAEWIEADFALWKQRREIDKKAAKRYAFYYYNGDDYSVGVKKYGERERRVLQFPMKKQNESKFVDDLKLMDAENIHWIIAPPSILFTLSCISIKYNMTVKIDIIESISEYLPEFYKLLFQKVFLGKVYVHYSCHEVWGMGFSDETGKIQIMKECILAQKTDSRFANGYGRCLVTNLKLKSMPFINYELSDLVKITGNSIETYGFRWTEEVMVGNKKIHCSFFDNIFMNFPVMYLRPLETYQIVYTDKKIVILLATTKASNCIKVSEYVGRKIREQLDFEIEVECIKTRKFLVDTVSGKMRGIVAKNKVNWEGWEFGFVNAESEKDIDKVITEVEDKNG